MAAAEISGPGYLELLAEVKAEVAAARIRAARTVNTELVTLYWRVGRLILERQQVEGWGTRVIDRLSVDLRTEFPGMRGFSTRSLVYMRTFAAAYPDGITQRAVAQLPWRHVTTLLDRVPDRQIRDWSPRPRTCSTGGPRPSCPITSRPAGTSVSVWRRTTFRK